jgi:hypothetical protein
MTETDIAKSGNHQTWTSTTTTVSAGAPADVLSSSTRRWVSAGAAADVLSFFNTTMGVCGFARRRPFPQRRRVSVGAPADVVSLLNTTPRARHPQSFPIGSPRPIQTGPASSTHAYRLSSTHSASLRPVPIKRRRPFTYIDCHRTDVRSVFNMIDTTGVCGCFDRRPLPLQYDNDTLPAHPRRPFPINHRPFPSHPACSTHL